MQFNLQKLKYERLSRGISQEEMAVSLGICRTSYWKRESGKIPISVEEFAKMLNRMGIPHSETSNFFVPFVPVREQGVG